MCIRDRCQVPTLIYDGLTDKTQMTDKTVTGRDPITIYVTLTTDKIQMTDRTVTDRDLTETTINKQTNIQRPPKRETDLSYILRLLYCLKRHPYTTDDSNRSYVFSSNSFKTKQDNSDKLKPNKSFKDTDYF